MLGDEPYKSNRYVRERIAPLGLKVSIKDICMVGQRVCLCGLDGFMILYFEVMFRAGCVSLRCYPAARQT